MLVTGMAGLVAGALSMAAGEYVSVSSQADTEQADLARERTELATDRKAEENELAGIYVRRGVEPALARTVALQLMARDALAAHARDELGISDELAARPLQAALASAATFAIGAALPIVAIDDVADGPSRRYCCERVAVLSGGARRVGGPSGWGIATRGCGAGGILGRSGDGCHVSRWRDIWCRDTLRLNQRHHGPRIAAGTPWNTNPAISLCIERPKASGIVRISNTRVHVRSACSGSP